MKIASWNVNSLNVRLDDVGNWLQVHQPDVLALQEIKMEDRAFPIEAFTALNYHACWAGQKTYNGVALITKLPAEHRVTELPSFADPQRRLIAATVGNCRIVNVYVPNGQALESEKFDYKLRWLTALRDYLQGELAQYPELALMGDFNIAPDDRDVYDPVAWKDKLHCSPRERQALAALTDLGLIDSFRLFEQSPQRFSWWDYRTRGYDRNRGLRIDLILLSAALAAKCQQADIDEEPRRQPRPSDHTPVWVSLA